MTGHTTNTRKNKVAGANNSVNHLASLCFFAALATILFSAFSSCRSSFRVFLRNSFSVMSRHISFPHHHTKKGFTFHTCSFLLFQFIRNFSYNKQASRSLIFHSEFSRFLCVLFVIYYLYFPIFALLFFNSYDISILKFIDNSIYIPAIYMDVSAFCSKSHYIPAKSELIQQTKRLSSPYHKTRRFTCFVFPDTYGISIVLPTKKIAKSRFL